MALNSEFIMKMPLPQKLGILAITVVVIIVGYFMLIDQGLTDEIEAQNKILKDKQMELGNLETVEKDKEKLDRELKEKERELEKAKEKLPTDTEMERLLLDINNLGQQNGINFAVFKPQNDKKSTLYIEVPIELTFTGSYRYVMNFFYKVTSLPRIVTFRDISIDGPKKGSSEVSVKTKAVTYKFAPPGTK